MSAVFTENPSTAHEVAAFAVRRRASVGSRNGQRPRRRDASPAPTSIPGWARACFDEMTRCFAMLAWDLAAGIESGEARLRFLEDMDAVVSKAERDSGTHATESGAQASNRPRIKGTQVWSRASSSRHIVALTRREIEVLSYVEAGVPLKKVAGKLGITLDTVYKHLTNGRRKRRIQRAQSLS